MTAAAVQGLRFAATPQHVLVTGGTGFIGRQLVTALLADGHAVTVLTRSPDAAGKLFAGRPVQAVRSLDALSASPAVDLVVNLAGARILGLPWTARRKQQLLASRVGTTRALAAWMASAPQPPRVLVSASAIGYYGIQAPDDDTQLDEGSPPQPIFMSQLCQEWEQAAGAAAAQGVAVRCLRFGVVLGRGGALPMLLLPVRLGLGGRLGTGRQWMSWIHIDDALGAIAQACRSVEAGVQAWNATAPQQVRQLEFVQAAAQVLGRPAFVPTPAWPVKLALGEQADLLLEGQRVHPARLLAQGFAFSHPGLDGALGDLCRARRPATA